MKVSLIVAVAKNGVIGKNNDLIWHLPKDLAFFKKMTSGHFMITGRKTFEALGKPLPNRIHLVVSSNFEYQHERVHVFKTVELALKYAQEHSDDEIFIAGGGAIYKYCLDNNLIDIAYITQVKHEFEGDTYFNLDTNDWKLMNQIDHQADEKNAFDMSFQTWVKK